MISTAGLTVHELGDAEAAGTLVLLHGLTDSGLCWPDAVRRWGPSYRLFAVDFRGHGTSPRFTRAQLEADPGDVLLADTVGLVEDVVELTGSPVVLVGHSMGAGLAGAAAALRPDLVRAAVLEEPAWGIRRDEAEVQRLALERTAWVQEFRDDLSAAMAKGRVENPTWPVAELDPWARAKQQTDSAFLAHGVAWPSTPWDEFARRIAVPTLVVTGDRDVIVDERTRADIAALANPHLEVAVVPGAGHCVRRDRGEEFHALVDPWLAKAAW